VASSPADSGPGANSASTSTPVTFLPSLPAVVDASVNWTLHGALAAAGTDVAFALGVKPLAPLTGDWDGDGSKTPAISVAGRSP
jgi:hypothetical protein